MRYNDVIELSRNDGDFTRELEKKKRKKKRYKIMGGTLHWP
jgi:hypothetical protein